MKKLLIGTSALVAVGLTAGAAQAADPIKLSLGGFAYELLTYGDSDDTGIDSRFDLLANNEIHFRGTTTLDNGLTVSFKYELEASGPGAFGAGDEYNISIAGGFGTLVMGAEDITTTGIALGAPHFGGFLLGAGNDDGTAGPTIGLPGPQYTYFDPLNDSDGITYVTPAFGGLTASASWMTGDVQGANGGVLSGADDIWAAGLQWRGDFNGVGLGAEVGYGFVESGLEAWQVGVEGTFGGFIVGAAYKNEDADGTEVGDNTAWEAGVGYETGPWGIGLAYVSSTTELGAAAERDDALWQLTSQYSIGPGINLVAGAARVESETTGAAELEGWVVQTGIGLAF